MKRVLVAIGILAVAIVCGVFLYIRELDRRAADLTVRSYVVEFDWQNDAGSYVVRDGTSKAIIASGERYREGVYEGSERVKDLMMRSGLHRAKGTIQFSLVGYDPPFPLTSGEFNFEPDPAIFAGYTERGDIKALRKLLASGHQVDERTLPNRQTALMIAAMLDRDDVAQFLLAAGANPNANDYMGMTPLMFAAGGNAPHTARRLLGARAELDASDDLGRTALSIARERQYQRVEHLLVAASAK